MVAVRNDNRAGAPPAGGVDQQALVLGSCTIRLMGAESGLTRAMTRSPETMLPNPTLISFMLLPQSFRNFSPVRAIRYSESVPGFFQ